MIRGFWRAHRGDLAWGLAGGVVVGAWFLAALVLWEIAEGARVNGWPWRACGLTPATEAPLAAALLGNLERPASSIVGQAVR